MIIRNYWMSKIEYAWSHHNIIWLAGVRRVGKTSLCQSLPNIDYFDCELPRVRQLLEDDPESFLEKMQGKRIILDEIHRLRNPAELLKIAADHFQKVNIIATGSSTLGASVKFRDTLAGRKSNLLLLPVLDTELETFGCKNFENRLLYGGLPPFLLSERLPEQDFQDWLDDYWAKDIQELFRLERRYSFLKFTELLLANSGGIFEATKYTSPCEVSRTTIANYLSVLEHTFVAHVIRPFSSHRPTEITAAPKVYGFDTGFICYFRGWVMLRKEDFGMLWEEYVLNTMSAVLQTRKFKYWRDKQKHEIDFVYQKRNNMPPVAIECKWSASQFDAAHLKIFRRYYPDGLNFVVAKDINHSFKKQMGDLSINFVNIFDLIKALQEL